MTSVRHEFHIRYVGDFGIALLEEDLVLSSTADAIQVASIRIRAHELYSSAVVSRQGRWLATVRWRGDQIIISREQSSYEG